MQQLGEANVINATTVSGPRGVSLPGTLTVHANSDTDLNTGAGAISLGLKLGRSVGVGINAVNRDVEASLGNASSITTTGNVSVAATGNQDYFSIAAAPAFGGSVNKPNFGGAVQVVSQINSVESKVGESTTVNAAGDVNVTASNTLDVDAITGSVSGAQNQSVAGSLNIVSLVNRTDAAVSKSAIINTAGTTGLTVDATGQAHPAAGCWW